MTVPGTVDGEIQQVTGTWYWYHTGTRIPHMDSRYKILRLSESRWNRGVEYQVPGTVSICVPWYCTWCNIIILLPLLFRRSWQELLRNKKLPTGKNPSGIFFFYKSQNKKSSQNRFNCQGVIDRNERARVREHKELLSPNSRHTKSWV